jgi:hypothetical protein
LLFINKFNRGGFVARTIRNAAMKVYFSPGGKGLAAMPAFKMIAKKNLDVSRWPGFLKTAVCVLVIGASAGGIAANCDGLWTKVSSSCQSQADKLISFAERVAIACERDADNGTPRR